MATSGDTKNEGYSMRALYEVIKHNLLIKDKDLVHFIRIMNDNISDDFKKVKGNVNLTINEITNRYENYTIVYMMVKSVMRGANITNYPEKAREITDMFLNDLLTTKPTDKPQSSVYDDED
jgi:hypothetical protein